jgi:uncharacterized protein YjdB
MTYPTECTGTSAVDRQNTSYGGWQPGVYSDDIYAQRFIPTSRCLYSIVLRMKKVLPDFGISIQIRDDVGGFPNMYSELMSYTVPSNSLPTSFSDVTVPCGILLDNTISKWITVSSEIYDPNLFDGREYFALDAAMISDANEYSAQKTANNAWTNHGKTSKLCFKTFKLSYATQNAQVYNTCWGSGLGTTCNTPPQQPVVTAGTTVTIKADLINVGPAAGKIRAVFKINGTVISDQNTASLAPFPGGGFWSPTATYLMPSSNVTLTVEGYSWTGTDWFSPPHIVTSTISSTTPTCTGISVGASTVVANVGDIITLTAYAVTPSTQPFLVTFTRRDNVTIGTCTTSNGMCSTQWNTAGLSAGTHYVKAAVVGSCTSTELVIGLSIPIQQWNVGINVKDSITIANIQGASVTVGTQTLQTNSAGYTSFVVDQGTIYVTISKTGYNTVSADPRSVYNNSTFDYLLVPVSQNPGSLRFITSPPGISGAEVHFIGDSPTLKGTTDVSGIFTIGSLVANRIVDYEVRKTGYNVTTGSRTVIGNVQTDVTATMTLLATTGGVCIHSNPAGASIKVDNVLQTGKITAASGGGCVTGNTVSNLTAGSHGYELSLPAYQNKTGNFSITVGRTLDYDAGVLTVLPTLGILHMWSVPTGARIYIMVSGTYQDTGYVTGTVGAPAVITDLVAAVYSYKLTLAGYNDYLSTFTITAGQTTVVGPTLVITPFTPSSAQIFNFCWGSGLGTTCNTPPQQPVVTAGATITIKADLANNGATGKIRAVFKIGGVTISDQNTLSLGTFPGGGFWSPTTTYQMPSNNVTLVVEGYGWDNTNWILTQTVTSTISVTTPTCTGVSIDVSTVVANVGDTITLTAYDVTPSTQPLLVTFTDRDNMILGTCTTSNGMCTIQWNTTGLPEGIYYVKAAVIGQCISTELAIGLSMPIQQWNVDINVRNSVTTANLQGAGVTVGTQTLYTDSSGHTLFRVNQGTIYVTISKAGYNTVNSDPQSVYNNVTFDYSLVPISQNPGSLRFITSPPGISGANVHFVGDVPTLKGTTDTNGIFTIGNLVANRVVNYEIRKTGYNIVTGSGVVIGNTTTDIIVTMTTLTTTGSVCIHSSPAGASVKIDNVLQTGKTTAVSGGGCLAGNTIGNLTAGNHSYELSLSSYQNKTGSVTIAVGQTLDHNAGALTPLPTLGILHMWSVPTGARIYIMVSGTYQDTGYVTGTVGAPAVITDLVAAVYSYKLTLAGYNDYLSTFTITAGQTTVVGPTLVITPLTTGTLSIWSSPTGAHIYTKLGAGQWQDTSHVTGPQGNPTQVSGLDPGNYSYKLTLPEYNDYIAQFGISAGQITSANTTLVPVYIPPTLTTITISPISHTISIGGTTQLEAVCKDQDEQIIDCQTLEWTSSDPLKATVDSSGLVTGVATGQANITASLSDITSNTSVITVTSTTSTLTTIAITPESVSVQIGDTQQMVAICKDQNVQTMNCQTLTWSNSEPLIATISSSGLVTGIATGSTVVSASRSGVASNVSVVTVVPPTSGDGGAGMLFGIVGVAALGMMMSSKKPKQ